MGGGGKKKKESKQNEQTNKRKEKQREGKRETVQQIEIATHISYLKLNIYKVICCLAI